MKYIKTRDALQAFYYLIAVDGSVRDDERALFDHIGDNLDAKHFHDYRKEIIDSCDERVNQCHDSDDRYDVIVEGVDAVLSHRTDKELQELHQGYFCGICCQLPSPMGNMMQ